MAKFDMVAKHKKGFINSTVGNGIRGSIWGGLIFGGLAALATVATGGLALPIIAGAAGAGAALFGTVNTVAGAGRWGMETLGGIIGVNRPDRGNGMDENGQEKQQGGPGLAEALVTAVVSAMGLNKLFGRGNQQQDQQYDNAPQHNAPQQAPRGQQAPSAFMPPQMPEILASNMKDGRLELTKDQLADPNIRGALQYFGEQQVGYRDALVNSGRRDLMEQARDMNKQALQYPGYKQESETFVINPEHAMDAKIVKHMSRDGERREKQYTKEMKTEMKELQRESSGIARGQYEQRFVENVPPVNAPQQQADMPDPRIETIHAEATNAKGNEMPLNPEKQQPQQEPSKDFGEKFPTLAEKGFVMPGKGMEQAAAIGARMKSEMDVELKGGTDKARAGASTGQARPQGQGLGQS